MPSVLVRPHAPTSGSLSQGRGRHAVYLLSSQVRLLLSCFCGCIICSGLCLQSSSHWCPLPCGLLSHENPMSGFVAVWDCCCLFFFFKTGSSPLFRGTAQPTLWCVRSPAPGPLVPQPRLCTSCSWVAALSSLLLGGPGSASCTNTSGLLQNTRQEHLLPGRGGHDRGPFVITSNCLQP